MSLVEVLVALMLLSIGLLAIAGSATLALRTALDTGRSREATQLAASRLARLTAVGCAPPRRGTAVGPGGILREEWSVTAATAGFARVSDSVSWMSGRGPRSFALTSAMQC